MKKSILALICWFTVAAAFAQQPLKQPGKDYYRQPLDGRLLLSANFAEARTDHFHSGIDVKTGGVEGSPLYAAADGNIVRIGVSPAGFGRVLYIDHPNGTTTVYAHMQRFTPELESFVTAERYRRKIHRGDFYPDAGRFPVAKGQLIGYSGNSGSSQGPHLHFEIRDTPSQRPLNVAKLGVYDITDDMPPRIVRLHYIEVDTVSGVPLNSRPRAIEVLNTNGAYRLKDTAALETGPNGYFVLEATDRKNDTSNTMGIYSVSVALDGTPVFAFRLDSFLFTEQRYVNSMTHYRMQKGSRNELIRLALETGNKLPVYYNVKNRGAIVLDDDNVHEILMTAEDDNGNASELRFRVRRRETPKVFYSDEDTMGIPVDCRRKFTRSVDGITVAIPAGALYASIFYRQSAEDPDAASPVARYSPIYTIHDDDTPLHSAISVSIDVPDAPQTLTGKLCIARVSADGSRFSNAGGKYENGRISAETRSFGRYCVVADTIPPTITPSFAEGADLRGKKSISFTLGDDFSGVASFTATIDGQWILFEQKGSTVTHTFDPSRIEYNGNSHEAIVTVVDGRGNSTTVKRKFIR